MVRWINVKANHSISWSIQPHKKSLNFGIFKHPGHSAVLNSSDSHKADSNENLPATAVSSARGSNSTSVIDKLTAIGLKSIQWIGKCEADKIAQGTYDVPQNEGGNYALVLDNTFSKQLSKTVTLVLFTYPTAVPPQSGLASANHVPGVSSQGTESSESSIRRTTVSSAGKPAHSADAESRTVHTGVLHKRRRRRHQGWARRYFTLDFASSTLSYYHDRNTSTLRGSIPLALAAVATNEKSREISVDSGAEVWHLRASGDQEFVSWKHALEKASKASPEDNNQSDLLLRVPSQGAPNPADDRQWDQVRSLVDQLSGSRDAVRQLAKDTDPKYLGTSERPRGRSPSPSPCTAETNGDDSRAKLPFWKRKPSSASQQGGKGSSAATSSHQLTVPGPAADTASLSGDRKPSSVTSQTDHADEVHDHLMGVLRDLDHVVSEFSTLIAGRKRRSRPAPPQPRRSVESDISQEFFDAMDGADGSPLLTIQDSDDEAVDNAEAAQRAEEAEVTDDAPSDSEEEMLETSTINGHHRDHSPLFPAKPKSLSPLPLNRVQRRTNVLAPTVMPPSLIGFFRKNVGKDLSQISTPVSSNEPFSMLQRAAEVLEYSQLLDKAAITADAQERLMYVTAFALSALSNNRVRERAVRKPFNPMLGETYELVREDRGFRFISEKVSHRPVQLAYVAESKEWSLAQSPMPSQKFWGKSAEIVAEGKFRLTLHATGEHFSWPSATSFLRNIIAGEKYVEPVGELAVVNESTGQKTISAFKAGGMFSGRSEDVSTKSLDPYGNELPLGLAGTWTSSLHLLKNGSPGPALWSAGPLVPNAPKHYGLTAFAASLNEVTSIEQDKLPPTDSRLRPDQRALEDGDVDRAEEVKVQLEEAQRARRREMENAGESWSPRWFTQVDDGSEEGEVAWRLKTGKDGYWDERAKGGWSGVVPVFKL